MNTFFCETHVDKAQDACQPELEEEALGDGLAVHLEEKTSISEKSK